MSMFDVTQVEENKVQSNVVIPPVGVNEGYTISAGTGEGATGSFLDITYTNIATGFKTRVREYEPKQDDAKFAKKVENFTRRMKHILHALYGESFPTPKGDWAPFIAEMVKLINSKQTSMDVIFHYGNTGYLEVPRIIPFVEASGTNPSRLKEQWSKSIQIYTTVKPTRNGTTKEAPSTSGG